MIDLPTSGSRAWGAPRTDHRHNGIDLQATMRAPVYAAAGGIVRHATAAWEQGFTGYGKVVTILSADGSSQLYAHLDSASVRPGERVAAGAQIGFAGRTEFRRADHESLIDAPHLHFEVAPIAYPMANTVPRYDPIAWLRDGRVHPISGLLLELDEGTAAVEPPFEPSASQPSSAGASSEPSPPSGSGSLSLDSADAERVAYALLYLISDEARTLLRELLGPEPA